MSGLRHWFWLHCPSCKRDLAVLVAPLTEAFGPSTELETFRRRACCEFCGHRGALTYLPSWGDTRTGFVSYPYPSEAEVDAMCNLYSQTRPVEAVRRLFGVAHIPSDLRGGFDAG